jgi:hypothetical protein
MRALARTLILVAAVSNGAGCASLDLETYRTVAIAETTAPATWQRLPLETGQIIVNEHPGGVSMFLSLITERYEPFIHAGLIVFEDDGPYVYEAFGSFIPLPWASPNDRMGGGVRRVPLESFLARGGIVAIYRPPPSVDRAALAEFARAHWRAETPFDGRYDASDPSKFYCAEFVARGLEAAGSAPIPTTPTTRNRSVAVAFEWLGIATPEFILTGSLIAPERRVALLSRHESAAEIERYFVLKRELHQRFTADQRLGNVIFWRGQSLHLRPQIVAYFDAGVGNQSDPVALADRMFLRPEPQLPQEQHTAATAHLETRE